MARPLPFSLAVGRLAVLDVVLVDFLLAVGTDAGILVFSVVEVVTVGVCGDAVDGEWEDAGEGSFEDA